MSGLAARAEVLRAHHAADAVVEELLAYNRNDFAESLPADASCPLPDEPFVAAWDGYARLAGEVGAFACLRERFPQLRFPVAAGTSESPEYLAATRRGEWPVGEPPGGGLRLRRPEGLRLFVHPTPAGRIPVLVAEEREDFVALVRAFTRRNEPAPVPGSMGACLVAGYNNWDRARAWPGPLRELLPRRELYQDRFVLLSTGPYSAVPAAALGLGAEQWAALSLRIRLEHECAHYVTRRVFGSMKNALHDELIADSTALLATTGRCRAEWLLRFLGLEDFPALRAGGRLENYRGSPPLSPAAFRVLGSLVVAAAHALEARAASLDADPGSLEGRARWIRALAGVSLEELAARPARAAGRGSNVLRA